MQSKGIAEALNSPVIEIISQELTEKNGIYFLKGDVKIIRKGPPESLVRAEEAIYNSLTGEAELTQRVYYEDSSMTIKANRAKINLKEKTGVLYESEIIFKKDFLRIITPEVQKVSEDHFIFKKATFTTCEQALPDWCIKGRDVDFIKGDRVTAKDATFNIKGLPVFYTPYIWAPALTERKTGFLIPSVSYSNRLGFELRVPFYIVLSENADTTLLLDLYTERGIGKAVELRYRGFPGNYLDLWTYHIRDSRLDKDFYEFSIKQNSETLKADREMPTITSPSGQAPYFREFISINTVTQGFFNTYNPLKEVRLTRFLSSAAEISYRTKNNIRLFVNAEYWQDLQYETSKVSQRLPEAGISLYPSGRENFYYWFEARAGNFYREEGIKGQRLWFMPVIMHRAGRGIVLSQSLSLEGSYYWLTSEPSALLVRHLEDQGFISELIYEPRLSTRLEREYGSFEHVIEPSIGYTRRETLHEGNDPLVKKVSTEELFDQRSMVKRTGELQLELLNRFLFGEKEGPDGGSNELIIKLSQPYDTFKDNLAPLTGELSLRIKDFHGALKTEYDIEKETLKTLTLRTGVELSGFRASIAERFSEDLDLFFLSSTLAYDLSRALSLNSTIWYDLKGGGLRNLLLGTSWKRQCWTLNLRYIKTPEDYSIQASIDLRGL